MGKFKPYLVTAAVVVVVLMILKAFRAKLPPAVSNLL